MKAQNTSFHDGGGGEERGKLFWRKVFPVPLSKDLKQGLRWMLTQSFTVAEV